MNICAQQTAPLRREFRLSRTELQTFLQVACVRNVLKYPSLYATGPVVVADPGLDAVSWFLLQNVWWCLPRSVCW